MQTVSSNFVAPRLLTAALAVAALAVSSGASRAQTPAAAPVAAAPEVEMISPAQWLARQPKPIFKPGHTMPRLTRYAYDLDVETFKELAGDWNYVVQTNYLSDELVANALKDPINDLWGKLIALSISDPKKYPLGVVLDRSDPPNPDPATFLRDAEGKLLNGNTYSPLTPQSTLDQMAELRARPLRELRKKVPINMVLNGGEYGLGVPGFMRDIAAKDPTVAAAQAASGLDWISFISKGKKREMDTIAAAVRKAVPDRNLYIYYATGPADRNRYWGWRDWGMDPEDALEGSDLPATEYYYKHFNSGFLQHAFPYHENDMLTRALNSTGFNIKHGKKFSYDWLCAGWEDEADPNAAPAPVAAPVPAPDKPVANADETRVLSNNNAAALVDPNAGGVSPMNLYTGFLKCIFTAGTLGGNAGYYALPGGGFNGPFPANKPKNYLPQMTALSHVQALFSHLENDVKNSDLMTGPNVHVKSTDQPAYEFPTDDVGLRVLARKLKAQDKWIITAWAANGVDRTVNVTIPTLGNIALSARAAGSVYIATIVNKRVQLKLTDSNAMMPTVKGFKPVNVAMAPSSNPKPAFVNGGFETPVLDAAGVVSQPVDTGWKWAPGTSIGIQRNGSPYGASTAPEGSQAVYLQTGGTSMSQIVSFSAGTYKVTFQAARRGEQMQPIQLKVDGVNVGLPITPTSDKFALYTSASFTVISGKHEISMATTNLSGDNSSFVDDVRIVAVTGGTSKRSATAGSR